MLVGLHPQQSLDVAVNMSRLPSTSGSCVEGKKRGHFDDIWLEAHTVMLERKSDGLKDGTNIH